MWRSSLLPLLLFTLLATVVYLPAYHAGYVTDFTGLVPRLSSQGAAGILHSYGFPALQPVLNLVFYVLYVLDGATGPCWYLSFTLLHGFNAWLLYRLIVRWLPTYRYTAVFAALLFLLSPYQTEVVVWRVCLNYLLSTGLLFTGLHAATSYFKTGRNSYFIGVLATTLVGLLCFEQVLVAPFLTVALWLCVPAVQRRYGSWLIMGQGLLVVGYFIALRLLIGQWVGHYGTDVHLHFPWAEMAAAPARYATRLLLLTRYWPHEYKIAFHQFLGAWYVSFPLLLLASSFIAYSFFYKTKTLSAAASLLAFGLSLLPVLNLHIEQLLWVQNDRYGYLASAFFYTTVVLLLGRLPRRWGLLVATAGLVLNSWFLWQTLRAWQDNSRVYRALIDTYALHDPRPAYILNLPDNLRGTPLFRSYHDTGAGLVSALVAFRQPPAAPIYEVMQYNLTALTDGVTVAVPRSDSLVVTFQQWGNWWWRNGLGAGSYHTDQYRVREQGHEYSLLLTDTLLPVRFLYQQGEGWREAR